MSELQFEHIVVLMLENRSFDHLFGYLGIGDGLTKSAHSNNLKIGDAQSALFTTRKGGDYVAAGEGPSHSLKQVNLQLFGNTQLPASVPVGQQTLNGFVASFNVALSYDLRRPPTENELQQVMNCFDPIQLQVLSTLARSFVLCDRWFADVPGPTMPNRAFVHAATSQGYTYNAKWKPAFTCDTIYDRLTGSGLSWRIYYHDQNDVIELYPRLKSNATHHVLFETNFLTDVAGDNLPTYSFIVPAFFGKHNHMVNSMHAPADVRPAEKLVADIYGALQSHQEVWRKTLYVIVFDEHGGYYDHVAPPSTVSPDGIPGRLDQDFLVPFDFQRLGLRVPAILVSPWFPAGVDSSVYSHSSLPGSLIEALNLTGGYLTERDKQANKLTQNYLLKQSDRIWRTDLPDLTVPVQPQPLDAMQRELLSGSVHLDPHPEQRDPLRTQDIQDPRQATDFIRTQISKHLEHQIAARAASRRSGSMTAENQLPSTTISPARVKELEQSVDRPASAPREAL